MQMSSKYFDDFALFEVPDDPSRPGLTFLFFFLFFSLLLSLLFSSSLKLSLSALKETKLTPFVHPWLSSRGLEFTSPGLAEKGFLYDEMMPSERKPIAKVFIKKWVFSPQRLADLFKDPVALKIIYAQALYLLLESEDSKQWIN
jgi:hypothetical protein